MRIRSSLRLWLLLGVAAFVCRIGDASSAAEVIVSIVAVKAMRGDDAKNASTERGGYNALTGQRAAFANFGGKSQSNLPEVQPRFASTSAMPALEILMSPPVSSSMTPENSRS